MANIHPCEGCLMGDSLTGTVEAIGTLVTQIVTASDVMLDAAAGYSAMLRRDTEAGILHPGTQAELERTQAEILDKTPAHVTAASGLKAAFKTTTAEAAELVCEPADIVAGLCRPLRHVLTLESTIAELVKQLPAEE